MEWGLLGPEALSGQRRARALDLGAAVRTFNDLAVPGMGGVWFGKQLLLATLGIALAEKARAAGYKLSNIETANAVEALACWLAFDHNDWQSDPRLRGGMKMQRKKDMSFAKVRQRSFYVTQPMRMRTVQPLLALGFVEGASERFNAFRCTPAGLNFIEFACQNYRPKNRGVIDNLLRWVRGDDCADTTHMRAALSPLEPLSKAAREFLHQGLIQGNTEGASRRKAAFAWMEALRQKSSSQVLLWSDRPRQIIDASHWRDLKTGALFFQVRDAALTVLDAVESHIGSLTAPCLELNGATPEIANAALDRLRNLAQEFLEENYDPSPQRMAYAFCRECAQENSREILTTLVRRDDRVLRLSGEKIIPGPAFRGWQEKKEESVEDEGNGEDFYVSATITWPNDISSRIKNLFWMNIDLRGELDRRLASEKNNGGVSRG